MAARAISFPMGSKKRAGKLPHNRREAEGLSENIDRDRVKNNPPHNVNQSLDEAYKHLFGEAVEKYNAKQTRNDRKIKDNDYYKKLFGNANKNEVAVSSNKEMSFYEFIIQVGDKDDTGCGEWKPLPPYLNTEGLTLRDRDGKPEYFEWSEAGKVATLCLDEWFNGNEALGIKSFQERNPNFYVFLDSTHIDEATPHKHVNYIPWAEFDKGIGVRNSHSQALRQMGYGKYDGDNNKERVAVERYAIHEWKLKERSIFERICNEHGFEIKPMEKGRGKDLSVPEIKKAKETLKADLTAEILKDVNAEKARIEQDIEILRHDLSSTKEEFFIENEKVEAVRVERDNLVAEIEEQEGMLKKTKGEVTAATEQLSELNEDINAKEAAKAELEAAIRPIEGRIAHEKRINTLMDGITDFTNPFTKKTTVTIKADMTAEEAKTVFNAAKDRDTMRVRRDNAVKERDSAVSERDTAVTEKKNAEKKLEGIEQREAAVKAAQKKADDKQAQAAALYQQQLKLNELYRETVMWRDKYKASFEESQQTVNGLRGQVSTLQQERDTAKNALQRTENALSKGLDCFTFTKEGNKVMVGCNFNAFVDAVKGEKPDHRVLERCRERERELNRLLNIGLSR